MVENAREELLDKNAQLEAVTESVPGIIMRIALDGTIEFINRAAPGFTREQIIGQSARMFIPPEQVNVFDDALASVQATKQSAHYRILGVTEQGERTFQSDMGPVVRDGQVVAVVVHTNDITEELERVRQAEEAKKQEARMHFLEEQDQFRRDLLNSVAHELNTPLTPLKLQLAILQPVLNHDTLDIMQRNVHRLEALVADLLDVARMDKAELTLKKGAFDLAALAHEAVETFAPMAEENGVRIHVDAEENEAIFDSLRLSQVCFNLLSNAIKFGAKNVWIDCRQGALRMRDDGPGFSDEEMERLFEPFQQIHASKIHGQPGTGLGLFLCKRILQAHGSDLRVQSPGPGEGAEFWFQIPSSAAS